MVLPGNDIFRFSPVAGDFLLIEKSPGSRQCEAGTVPDANNPDVRRTKNDETAKTHPGPSNGHASRQLDIYP
jgi:hypothetical protein